MSATSLICYEFVGLFAQVVIISRHRWYDSGLATGFRCLCFLCREQCLLCCFVEIRYVSLFWSWIPHLLSCACSVPYRFVVSVRWRSFLPFPVRVLCYNFMPHTCILSAVAVEMWVHIDCLGSADLPAGSRQTPTHLFAQVNRSLRAFFVHTRFSVVVIKSNRDWVATIEVLDGCNARSYVR